MRHCKNCKWSSFGTSDPYSDICDGCQDDPDTGWGGFTDHSIGKHFYSLEERAEYLKNHPEDEDDGDKY